MLPTDHPLAQAAFAWANAERPTALPADDYCATRDVFRARLDSFRIFLLRKGGAEERADLLRAVLGEIGNNSFDHNLGAWKDIPGVCFTRTLEEQRILCALADRGQGILSTLRNVRPSLASDAEALRTAFLERLSGRAPEVRGNGLKFVRGTLLEDGIDLFFQSGRATYTVRGKEEQWGESGTSIFGCCAVLACSLR